MSTSLKSSCFKLCKLLSLTLLFSSTISNVIAEESEYYSFPTGEQEGGGVRGELASCDRNASLIPLVPQNAQTLTASASPKLFFDVSKVQQATVLDFLLLDRDDRIVYHNSVEADHKSGLISLNLLDSYNSNQLELNNSYHWYLINQCDDSLDPQVLANGSLQRIKLKDELVENINSASTQNKTKMYQEANLWHETVENIAQLKCSNSQTKIREKELRQMTEAIDISIASFNNSLDNYCAKVR